MTDLARELAKRSSGWGQENVQPSDYYPLEGGLNLADPNLRTSPGEVIGGNNYEPGLRGGYRRADGFERLDGRARPHLSTYSAADAAVALFLNEPNNIQVGDVLTGSVSGATVVWINYLNGRLYVTDIQGTPVVDDEFGKTGVQEHYKISELFTVSGAPDDDTDRLIKYATQDYYRGLIEAVPGEGPVRGVWVHRDGVYAFRDNVGATEGKMYEATTSGWSAIALGMKVRFWRGEREIEEGDVLTGVTSGATCTVKRVAVFRGTWGAKDALGFIITDAVTGTYSVGEELQVNSKRVGDLYPDSVQDFQLFFSAKAVYHAVDIVAATAGSFNEDEEADFFEQITFHRESDDVQIATGYYLGANKAPADKPTQIGIVEWDGGTLTNQARVKNKKGSVFAYVKGAGDPERDGSDIAAVGEFWQAKAEEFYTDEDVDFTATEKIEVGNTVTGSDSGASLVVTQVILTSGEWEDKTARGYVWADSVTGGTFTDGEELTVAGDVVGHAEDENGQVLQVRFYSGSKEPEEGDTVTGATSTATLEIKDLVLLRGDWDEGNAEGYLTSIPASQSGTFTQDENLQIGGSTFAKATPDDTTIVSVTTQTLKPGGHYEFRNFNFGGHEDTRRMYGVNGQQNAFEYDKDDGVVVMLESGMGKDRPIHLAVYSGHLFLAFDGGSVQHSGYLEPYSFHPVTGADERTVGEAIVGMQEEKQALFIFTRQQTFVLYGDVRENFQMRPYAKDTGAIEWTIQRIGQSYYVDDRGITNLQATDAYGNFAASSISQKIESLVRSNIQNNNLQCSTISRRKNLYRIFFGGGDGLVLGVGREGVTGFMPFDMGGKRAFCACSEEFESGTQFEERALVGAIDGFVYELDVGDNFDGGAVEAFIRTAPHYSKTPNRYKRYRQAQIDVQAEGKATLEIAAEYNFGLAAGGKPSDLSVLGGGGFWNIDNWGEFKWSSPAKSYLTFKMEGSGYNITFLFYHKKSDEPSHTLYGIMLQWSLRRLNRVTTQ